MEKYIVTIKEYTDSEKMKETGRYGFTSVDSAFNLFTSFVKPYTEKPFQKSVSINLIDGITKQTIATFQIR